MKKIIITFLAVLALAAIIIFALPRLTVVGSYTSKNLLDNDRYGENCKMNMTVNMDGTFTQELYQGGRIVDEFYGTWKMKYFDDDSLWAIEIKHAGGSKQEWYYNLFAGSLDQHVTRGWFFVKD